MAHLGRAELVSAVLNAGGLGIKEIKPVRVIIEEIVAETETIITNLKKFYGED